MLEFNKPKCHVIVSLSGGMDSSTLLLRCLKEYDSVTAISFDYGQKHRVELEKAQSLVDYLNSTLTKVEGLSQEHQDFFEENGIDVDSLIKSKKQEYGPIKYHQIRLDGLVNLLDSTLVTGGKDVPEGHYAEDNQKATVVPNRNKIFSSITQAVALSIANRTGETCDIALGIHNGDHEIYPDCRQEFRDADDAAFRIGNWDADRVGFFTPYLEGDKFTILQDGEVLCTELGLDFNEVYKRTNTSYKPYPSGNSDYKSASSVERVLAFIKLGVADPVQYEDETGPVGWEVAKAHAIQIEEDFLKENK
ncbi:MAG TPA: 7-cyano-7-deazaguanine synthase [Candidatus Absconditabacterales bacterium]|nr:7-cyano-7-deazaguanine synthase [Candidatus Absconditabacterales bacterium]